MGKTTKSAGTLNLLNLLKANEQQEGNIHRAIKNDRLLLRVSNIEFKKLMLSSKARSSLKLFSENKIRRLRGEAF